MIRPTKENQLFILDNGVKVISKLVPKCKCKGCYFFGDNGCTTNEVHRESVSCYVIDDISTGAVSRYIFEKVND